MLSRKGTDLLKDHYRNIENWRVKEQTHERYTQPKVNFVNWTMNRVQWQGDETVLDAGCGPGRYFSYFQQNLPDATYIGLDYSTSMVSGHPAQSRLVRGALDTIPLPDNTFDVVMANHVLYMLPDIELAIQELQRVLKPNGVLVSATNSITTMPQFRELFRRSILLVSTPGTSRSIKPPVGLHQRFSLENGSVTLARHFDAVVRHDMPGAFVFSQVDPIMDYLESSRTTHEPQLPASVTWDQVMVLMREQLVNLLSSLDKLVVDKLTGVLIATNGGGFIQEFTRIREEQHKSGQA